MCASEARGQLHFLQASFEALNIFYHFFSKHSEYQTVAQDIEDSHEHRLYRLLYFQPARTLHSRQVLRSHRYFWPSETRSSIWSLYQHFLGEALLQCSRAVRLLSSAADIFILKDTSSVKNSQPGTWTPMIKLWKVKCLRKARYYYFLRAQDLWKEQKWHQVKRGQCWQHKTGFTRSLAHSSHLIRALSSCPMEKALTIYREAILSTFNWEASFCRS